MEKYYVYVYYDPRNFKIFYIGKGKGKRKQAHLRDFSQSEKAKTIKDIQKEGLEPIVRVIANNLTEKEALLVESTLIWENFEALSNKVKGNYSKHFRPQNTLHKDIQGFDYQNNIYYVNIGEGDHRDWEDCKKYGFICAGGDPKWSDPLLRLNEDDIVLAYLKTKGYVGLGKVTNKRVKAIDFIYKGKKLFEYKNDLAQPNIFENPNNNEIAQYCVGVKWIKQLGKDNALWKRKSGIFTTQQVVASMLNQPGTINYLSKEFGIDIYGLIEQ